MEGYAVRTGLSTPSDVVYFLVAGICNHDRQTFTFKHWFLLLVLRIVEGYAVGTGLLATVDVVYFPVPGRCNHDRQTLHKRSRYLLMQFNPIVHGVSMVAFVHGGGGGKLTPPPPA